MSIAYIFIVGCSLAFLFTVAVIAARNHATAGSKAFLMQIACITIWSVGSLLEMLAPTEQGMLLWRNVQQIGIFLIPVACVYFAVDYAQYVQFKKYIPLLLILPILAILLIFTDSKTHFMRTGYIISYSPLFGKALSVQQTNLGKILVANNYLLAFVSLVILFVFSRQVTKSLRRQVVLNFLAIGLIFVLGFLKSVFLEGTRINIPIVAIYLPSSVILFYNLYKNNVFRVSPIAREKVFDVVEMGIVVTDGIGIIADVNPFAFQLLNTTFGIPETVSGKRIDEVFADFPGWVTQTKLNSVGEIELHLLQPNEHYIQIRVYPLQSGQGAFLGSVSIMSDVTAVRLQEFALKTKAETDGLTGLMNRESFLNVFSGKLQAATPEDAFVSVLMMDLDKFKNINDTYGHNVGDQVIAAFADLLRNTLRQEDAIARFGGDEFVALLPGIAKHEAAEIANRILKSARSENISIEGGVSIPLVVSIGICDNAAHTSQEEILQRADQAMYLAKAKNGDCCVLCE